MKMRPIWILCVLFAGLSMGVLAQQPAAPTLDQVLAGIQDNATAFRASVPNLGADEHVVSSASGTSDKATNSIFRLRRGSAAPQDLVESREAGDTPAGSEQQVKGPSIVIGLFSSGTRDFSPDLKHCYNYQLVPKMQQLHHVTVVVVKYDRKERLRDDTGCPVTDPVSGKAYVDSATMQVLRVEQVLHLHELEPGRPGFWTWTWSIDYAQIELGGKSFWLPQTISSWSSVPVRNGPRSIDFRFVSTYRNYHLLEVHSTILPAGTTP